MRKSNLIRRIHMRRLILPLATLMLAACSFIPVQPGADKVALLPDNFVGSCQHLGQTNAMVPTHFGFIEHGAESIEKSLAAIARNDAVGLGGDTIVKTSPVKEGRQSFKIYKCRK
jgi:hypothetical protein